MEDTGEIQTNSQMKVTQFVNNVEVGVTTPYRKEHNSDDPFPNSGQWLMFTM